MVYIAAVGICAKVGLCVLRNWRCIIYTYKGPERVGLKDQNSTEVKTRRGPGGGPRVRASIRGQIISIVIERALDRNTKKDSILEGSRGKSKVPI